MPQHFLYFFPDPHGHGSLRPAGADDLGSGGASAGSGPMSKSRLQTSSTHWRHLRQVGSGGVYMAVSGSSSHSSSCLCRNYTQPCSARQRHRRAGASGTINKVTLAPYRLAAPSFCAARAEKNPFYCGRYMCRFEGSGDRAR